MVLETGQSPTGECIGGLGTGVREPVLGGKAATGLREEQRLGHSGTGILKSPQR